MAERDDFYNWCLQKGNEDFLEQIVQDKLLHLRYEDDLLIFLIKVIDKRNEFGTLFQIIALVIAVQCF